MFRSPNKHERTTKGVQQHSKQMSMSIVQNENLFSPRRRKQNGHFNSIDMILESQKVMFNKKK